MPRKQLKQYSSRRLSRRQRRCCCWVGTVTAICCAVDWNLGDITAFPLPPLQPWKATRPKAQASFSKLHTSRRKKSASIIPNGNIATRQVNSKSGGDGNEDNEACNIESTRKARERQPPFPAFSYMTEEEEKLNFDYVSFIDQSILRSYSQQTRLVEPRGYAIPDQFKLQNKDVPPTIDDVAMPSSKYGPIACFFAWNGLPARTVVGSASYLAFPYLIAFLDTTITGVDHTELSKLVDSFLPGVAIVLGTYFSLTLSILYDRLAKLQEAVNAEASVLVLTVINLLHLFEETRSGSGCGRSAVHCRSSPDHGL